MTDPRGFVAEERMDARGGTVTLARIDTGVPHVVVEVADIGAVDVIGLGRELRHHPAFRPAGTNVNFTAIQADGRIFNRTYERGVEGETQACGTGAVAAALVMAARKGITSPVTVVPRSGEVLRIYFEASGDRFTRVYLEGNARIICTDWICSSDYI